MIIPLTLTAVASTLHGQDRYSKGLIMAVHVALIATYGLAMGEPFVALAGAALFWQSARRSTQARAELDTLQDITLENVLKCVDAYIAFYVIAALYSQNHWLLLGVLVSPVVSMVFSHRVIGVRDNRRAIEWMTGIACGAAIGFCI